MDNEKVLAHVQHVARHFIAWRGHLPALIKFVAYSLGDDAPEDSRLDNFLRRESTQETLRLHYETGLWIAPDKTWRLVCLAVPDDPAVAKRRLNNRPTSASQCRWCHIDEKSRDLLALKPELNIRREHIAGSYLHPICQRSWMLLYDIAEQG